MSGWTFVKRAAMDLGRWVLVVSGVATVLVVFGGMDEVFSGPDDAEGVTRDRAVQNLGAQVWSLEFGADRWLAAATITGEVWVKDLTTGECSQLMSSSMNQARCVAFTPDGRFLAVAGGPAGVRIWDMTTGLESSPIDTEPNVARHVAFTPDGTRMAVAGFRGRLTLWNVAERRRLITLAGHEGPINALAFSPDGAWLATGDSGGVVKLWRIDDPGPPTTLPGRHLSLGGVNALAFSPNGQYLASSSMHDRAVHLWDCRAGRTAARVPAPVQGVNSVRFSRSGDHLVLACGDGTARNWSVAQNDWTDARQAAQSPLHALAFSPDGYRLATGDARGSIRIWNALP